MLDKNGTYKIILSGGGTGGHIYPAIAIANELKNRFPNAEFLFVGAKDRMEMQKVPQAGYKIKGLWISGIQRKLTLKNLMFPFKLISSLYNALQIVVKFKPNVAIGTGGFASGPLLQVASLKNVPTLIQEQNSYPGITNKLLSKRANKICVAYDNLERFFPKNKIVKTGNPVRQDLLSIENKHNEATNYFKLDANKKTILVLGGSLGAKAINELVADHLEVFKSQNVQVIWQCGKLYEATYMSFNSNDGVQVSAFIDRMDLAYAAADVIISRAGASSVSELCIVGKPVIFVPSPFVAEDHQTKNAESIVSENAAIMIKQSDIKSKFSTEFNALIESQAKQDSLSENIKKLALENATKDIANEVEELLLQSLK